MSKDEIKATITNLKLPEELEKIIFDMVDSAEEVNGPLLNAIADILDNQADHDNSMADAYDDLQQVDDMTQKELQALDAEQDLAVLQAESQIQDDMIKELENNPDQQMTADTESSTGSPDVPEMPQESAPPNDLPPASETATEPAAEIPSEPQPSYAPSSSDVAAQMTAPAPTVSNTAPAEESGTPMAAPPSAEAEQDRQESIAELKDKIAQMGDNPPQSDPPANPTVA